MRRGLIGLLLLCLFGSARADQDTHPETTVTSSLVSGRYEIVQSTLSAKLTFKLDRYSGRVWQLVKDSEENYLWQETVVQGLSGAGGALPAVPNFQIFLSGLTAKDTLLFDVATGRAWVLTTLTAPARKPGVEWLLIQEGGTAPFRPYLDPEVSAPQKH